MHHIDNAIEVRAIDIHFVDIAHTRNLVHISLSPNGFRLGLNAALCTEDSNGAVENAQRALNLYGKVNVAGGVDNVNTRIFPEASGSSGGNGDTSLLLLLHPVHGSAAVMSLAHLVRLTCVVQDTLSGRGLTGVDMSHDTDVSGTLK